MDFEEQALIGYEDEQMVLIPPVTDGLTPVYQFYGTEGPWSNTQTITLGVTAPATTPGVSLPPPSASPSESQSPITLPSEFGPQSTVTLGLDWTQTAILILFGIIAVSAAFIAVFLYKKRQPKLP